MFLIIDKAENDQRHVFGYYISKEPREVNGVCVDLKEVSIGEEPYYLQEGEHYIYVNQFFWKKDGKFYAPKNTYQPISKVDINEELVKSIYNDIMSDKDLVKDITDSFRNKATDPKYCRVKNWIEDEPVSMNLATILEGSFGVWVSGKYLSKETKEKVRKIVLNNIKDTYLGADRCGDPIFGELVEINNINDLANSVSNCDMICRTLYDTAFYSDALKDYSFSSFIEIVYSFRKAYNTESGRKALKNAIISLNEDDRW